MDEPAQFRILSMDQFMRLTIDQKFAYVQTAIKALLGGQSERRATTAEDRPTGPERKVDGNGRTD